MHFSYTLVFLSFSSAASAAALQPGLTYPPLARSTLESTSQPSRNMTALSPLNKFLSLENSEITPTTTNRYRRQPQPQDTRPTPAPTGSASPLTTVHITDEKDFALLMPGMPGELVSDAETDGVSYCTPGHADCTNILPPGFILAAEFSSSDDGSYIQVTGCIDVSKFANLDPTDSGGQFDARFPNGAQCTFGGYGMSFIEQVEPGAGRFCLRCCSTPDDQTNCNSHMDRGGCTAAIPGVYDFPQVGVSCS